MKTKLITLFLALVASTGTMFAESGKCGENLTWDLTDGVLTISGSGAMYDSGGASWDMDLKNLVHSNNPWYDYANSIKSILLSDELTTIGSYAFANCTHLTSITILNSVTSIGESAFYGCEKLTSVIWNAKNCSDFSAGYTPFNYTEDGKLFYFDIRAQITSFVFGNEVEHIPAYLCSSMSVLSNITIPNSVASIGGYAFSGCSGLTSVTIPNSVTSIGESAFSNCNSLNSVTIPNSVTTIGNSAFSGCSGLTSITIPNSVTSIGEYAFAGDGLLTSINVATDNPNYCSVDGVLFNKDKTSLIQYPASKSAISYSIPNSVTSIGKSAFNGCSGLTSIEIPNSVTSIGNGAFNACSGLTKVSLNSNFIASKTYTSKSYKLNISSIFGSQIKEYIIGDDVTSIGDWAFAVGTNLTSVTIGESVTSIGKWAFASCTNLTSVTIGESVTSIGECAFLQCEKLTSVIWNAKNCSDFSANDNPFIYYDEHTYYFDIRAQITSFVFGNEVEHIPAYLCSGMLGLSNITIPNSVTSIGSGAFDGCNSLTSVHISDIAAWCKITFGSNPLSYAHNLYLNGTLVTDLVIPNSVTSIGNSAFNGCTGLTSLTIGESVTSIGDGAFSGCSGLTSIEIPNSVSTIGNSAFSGCSSLTSVTIPNSVTTIGDYAFNGCSGLTSITIPNSVTSIGKSAFNGCSSLTSVTIPNSVTTIGGGAFYSCSSLTSVTIPNSVTSIGGSAFRDCNSLTSVTIGNSVTSIGNSAFNGCTGVTSVVWNAKNCNDFSSDNTPFLFYQPWGSVIFDISSQITSFVFGNEVEHIPAYLCSGMSQLSSRSLFFTQSSQR
ncbi:MAG: leucine-rich repeat domain-containing protein [Paludibacteraceae bacterium]|nr:leucine-rich repeat domain-containing protein [Paludibacteraceae bacterium]